MENEPQGSKRSIRDISHLFLSSVESREKNIAVLPDSPYVLAFLQPEKDCSFECNLNFARKVESRFSKTVIVDFHRPQYQVGSFQTLPGHSIVPCFLDLSENIHEALNEHDANLWLMDLPWYSPGILESIIRRLDALVLVVNPTISSFKNAFRLLKSISHLLSEDPFVMWEGKSFQQVVPEISQWGLMVNRFLKRNFQWIEDPQTLLEKVHPRSENFSSTFLNVPSYTPSFFKRAQLTEDEIDAFLAFACQRPL